MTLCPGASRTDSPLLLSPNENANRGPPWLASPGAEESDAAAKMYLTCEEYRS